jgi:diguanylate cyclase (GGDEF)-like protein/putative nucleotidyltransferase with HDIG domain
MALAALGSFRFYHWDLAQHLNHGTPILLLATALILFCLNTLPIAGAVALTESKPLGKTWQQCYFWSFPFYLIGACITWIIDVMTRQIHWQASVLLLPVLYFIYRSYRTYLGRLEDEKRHVEEIAGLHLRTIEALAMAIDAKDHTTHDHLRRVRTYAIEIGKEMRLSPEELEALRAAAVLHDIGKLAVPEHIISKPGKLTLEEFEKMKIHPVVGAEILERVAFPYPVVPIVRSHHEKWDGSGYPDGLQGEAIPIGARILAAVDCLDALASDRQYRRALALDDAMDRIEAQSGTTFDPAVVTILRRRYEELERNAVSQSAELAAVSKNVKIERGEAPAAGFETSAAGNLKDHDFLASIAAARQEVQLLFELTRDLGNSLSLDETLSVVAMRLKHMIPYDSIAVYVRREGRLAPEYVNGEDFRLISSLEIPVGAGLSGWVAEHGEPILNGTPSVESSYLNDSSKCLSLRSALSVPLEGLNGRLGVLTLYRSEADAFSKDHLRILLAITSKVSLALENAFRYRQAESSATTDYLTGLPNARSLFLRLDAELARAKRSATPLSVLVCDLDGFKQINDRYGHLEGNNLLRTVAEALRENCREYDYVARMGGDEFVILIPGLGADKLQERTAELRRVVSDAGHRSSGTRLVSVSIGEAHYPSDGADADRLLAEADRRMYKNKQVRKARRQEAGAAPAGSAHEQLIAVQ